MTAQDLVKRYFWLVGAITVALSAFFVAKAVGHVVEATALADAKHGPKVTAVAPTIKPTSSVRNKSGIPLADRNMFCHDCLPPQADTTAAVIPGQTPITSLPLVLVATNVGGKPDQSFATILNNDTQKQGAYFANEVIPAAGPIKEIHFKYVDFTNQSSNRVERIMLLGEAPVTHTAEPPPLVASIDPGSDQPKDDLSAAIDAGIKKIDESTFEVDRGLVDKVLANPMAVAKGARVVPSVKNGKANGFKLYAIRPSSVYAKLGLSNGDTIHSINGFDLTSPDKALEVYTKVKEATSLSVSLTRRGKPMNLNYSIR